MIPPPHPLFLLLFVLFLFIVRPDASAAQQDGVAKIIGGKEVPDGRYPYAQISLQRPRFHGDTNRHQCGGSLIAPDIVLTAAHCLGWFTQAHIDRYDFDSPSEEFQVIEVVSAEAHVLFDEDCFRYDFAIVLLEEQVQGIAPVQLNTDDSIPSPDTKLVVLGWGATEYSQEGIGGYSSTLLQGDVQALSNDECQKTEVDNKTLYSGEVYGEMLCAYDPSGVDSCSGDRCVTRFLQNVVLFALPLIVLFSDPFTCVRCSGGPLILEGSNLEPDVLVGLVSWGRGCAIYPGVYSRVSMAYVWIRAQVCYKSLYPPASLECLPSERDPIYAEAEAALSTPMPSIRQSLSPTVQTNTMDDASTFGQTNPQTLAPMQNPLQTSPSPSLLSPALHIQSVASPTLSPALPMAVSSPMTPALPVAASSAVDQISSPESAGARTAAKHILRWIAGSTVCWTTWFLYG